MSHESYKLPSAKGDVPIGIALGIVFSFLLFVAMAVAQNMGDPVKPKNEMDTMVIAMEAPELEEFEEEIIEEEPEEEETPELEEDPPELSLDQLDLALNPGTGGDVVGDFALPGFEATTESTGTLDVFDFADLDRVPQRISGKMPVYPRSLRSKRVGGEVRVKVVLLPDGTVSEPKILSSPHPDLSSAVLAVVGNWKFEQPTINGRNVQAAGTFTIPFNIK